MIVSKGFEPDNWTAKSVMTYTLHKLAERGVQYRPAYPRDMMFVGVLFKSCKRAGKTNAFIKQRLDERLSDCDLKRVVSLQFILSFFPDVKLYTQMKRSKPIKKTEISLPDHALETLRNLKKSITKPGVV